LLHYAETRGLGVSYMKPNGRRCCWVGEIMCRTN